MNRSLLAVLRIALTALLLLMAAAAAAQQQTTVTVSTVQQLRDAVSAANSAGGHYKILVADGTYTLPDTLYINAPNISIGGLSEDRERVVIQGDAMSGSAQVGNIIRVAGSHFRLEHVTLQRARWHAIQIAGENNADYPVIRNCVLRDTFEQLLKVTVDPSNLSVTSDHGLVENCIFEYLAGVGGRGAGEKCADEPVAAANADAVIPLSDDQFVQANAARRYRHRTEAGTG